LDFKKEIKELRQRTGLSQAKFAQKFFIPTHTVETWEMGIRKPPVYVVKMIALILDYEDRFKEKD
jgi:putative transcriptional regulator